MSIRIELWRGDTQIGRHQTAVDPDPVNGISEAADSIVDQLITAVYGGKHGEGKFRIEAEHVDGRGVFLGSYYRNEFSYPRQNNNHSNHANTVS